MIYQHVYRLKFSDGSERQETVAMRGKDAEKLRLSAFQKLMTGLKGSSPESIDLVEQRPIVLRRNRG